MDISLKGCRVCNDDWRAAVAGSSVSPKSVGRHIKMSRIKFTFGALNAVQAAHSIEEYVGRLWESFPPARFLTVLISSDRELGFVVINGALVPSGVWCVLFPVRREWPTAGRFVWFWIVLETINGLGHPAWALRERGYVAGVLTAPILLMIAVSLAFQLRNNAQMHVRAA